MHTTRYALAIIAMVTLVTTGCSTSKNVVNPPPTTAAPNTAAAEPPIGSLDRPTTIKQTPGQCHAHGQLPDPACTPGAIDPRVTQENIDKTICRKGGYTDTVRPPTSYTNRIKKQQMAAYGFTDSLSAHEEDHLISLQLGGAPNDPRNLWPEPDDSPNPKDAVENTLHRAVCKRVIGLSEAQRRIATNWTTALKGIDMG